MPIYPPTPDPFKCAICRADRPSPWCSPQMKDRPPVCWRCEQDWGTGTYGDCNPDRRTLKQISALANCLAVEAHRGQLGLGALHG